jgi:hypothetical protein
MVMAGAAVVARFLHHAYAEEVWCLHLIAWQEVRTQAIIVDNKQEQRESSARVLVEKDLIASDQQDRSLDGQPAKEDTRSARTPASI